MRSFSLNIKFCALWVVVAGVCFPATLFAQDAGPLGVFVGELESRLETRIAELRETDERLRETSRQPRRVLKSTLRLLPAAPLLNGGAALARTACVPPSGPEAPRPWTVTNPGIQRRIAAAVRPRINRFVRKLRGYHSLRNGYVPDLPLENSHALRA